MDYQHIAAEWRKTQPENRAKTGIVLIWDGRVYGWKDKLRDAADERPGAIAVDANGNVYRATAGTADHGARGWVVV